MEHMAFDEIVSAVQGNVLIQGEFTEFNVISTDTRKIDDENFMSLHKLVAVEANLGKIDEKGVFKTNEDYTEVNLGTVLTDASL